MVISTKKNDLVYFKNRCNRIVEFMLEKNPDDKLLPSMQNIIKTLVEKADLNGLKLVSNDLDEWIKGFPEKDISKLNKILDGEFNHDQFSLVNKIRSIETRGYIQSDQEFRDVNLFIDLEKESKEHSIQKRLDLLNNFILTYEQKMSTSKKFR